MFHKKTITKSIKLVLIGGATASAFSFPVLAAETEDNVERISVTGSRIKRTDMETSVPITTMTRADIEATGAINVADLLNQSPVSIADGSTANSAFQTVDVGLSSTSLRNLGDERTLVLVNGRRFVSGRAPGSGYAVDLNSIPTSIIQRIDILKSASSAVYGSDAVAGVVNIITRTDINGIDINAQTGTSSENDRDTNTVNILAGKDFDGGNTYVAFGVDYDDGIKSVDRPFSANDKGILLDANGNEYVGEVNSSYPPQGRITYDGTSFNGDGTAYTSSSSFNRAEYRQLMTPLERKYVAAGLTFEINDKVSFFSEVNWNTTKTNGSTIEPTPLDVVNDIWLKDRNGTGGLAYDSPLVPDLLSSELYKLGVTNLNETSFVRRMVEVGARSTDVERDTIRVVGGFDWTVNDTWTNNTYFNWGRTDSAQDNGGQINIERANQALNVTTDATTGELVCADNQAVLQGCEPLNMFGEGTISTGAADYIRSPAHASSQVEQTIAGTSFSGELPVELAGGYIGLSVGYEYREESGIENPADLAQTGASSTNQSDPTDGSYHTNDIFGEAVLPVLEELDISLAARWADNSITGGDWTWNVGVEYSPIDQLKLRASAARAIRTPNVSDLYAGNGETFATVSDPCSGITASTTGTIADNCRSIKAISDRITADGEFILTQAELQGTGGVEGGNPDVQPETADSYSVGLVWQAMEKLAVTVDYYNISIKDAIDITDRDVVLTRCYSQSTSTFTSDCNGAAIRDENGALIEVNSSTSNENNIDTSGLDTEVHYALELGEGEFSTHLLWNYIFEWKQTGIIDGISVDYAGEVDYPEHRVNLDLRYDISDFTVNWRVRYWDEVVDSVDGSNFNFTDGLPLTTYNNVDAIFYHDLSAGYTFDENYNIYAGVNNIFNQQPRILPQGTYSGDTGTNTATNAYDVVGRYFYAGVTLKF